MNSDTLRNDTTLGQSASPVSRSINNHILGAVFLVAILLFFSAFPPLCLSKDTLASPESRQFWVYNQVSMPVASSAPDQIKPVSIGPLESDTSFLAIRIKLPKFSGPVDVYSLCSHGSFPNHVLNMQPDLTFKLATVEAMNNSLASGVPPPGVEPWLRAVVAPVDDTPLKIRTSHLLPGNYTVYLLVTPSGTLGTFYLWATSFQLPQADVGLIVSFPGRPEQVTPQLVRSTYDIVRNAGFRTSHMYHSWGDIEKERGVYDWRDIDFDMQVVREQKLKASLVLKIIDTNLVGRLPEDLGATRFDDILFKNRAKEFLMNLLRRHHDVIQYLWIGNEIDDFFFTRRHLFDGYINLYKELYASAKSAYPHIKIGTVSTYHDAKNNSALDLIEKIGALADIIGFSLYPQIIKNEDARDIGVVLRELTTIAQRVGKRYVITETGWSTEGLGGSEEGQAQYFRSLFRAYSNRDEWIEVLQIFMLYDFPESVKRALAEEQGIGRDKELLQFVGSIGLARSDGTFKKGWRVVMEEMTTSERPAPNSMN